MSWNPVKPEIDVGVVEHAVMRSTVDFAAERTLLQVDPDGLNGNGVVGVSTTNSFRG